jgi:hypothetical protein
MNEQDFTAFDEMYFKQYDGWGEVPATVWDMAVWDKETDSPRIVAEADSPYDLMDAFAMYGVTHGAVLAVRGWGAPIEEGDDLAGEVRPSLHPERKRMVMYLHIQNEDGKLSVAVHPQDEELMFMHEQGIGTLADAIYEAVEGVKAQIEELQALATDLVEIEESK